MTGCFGSNKTLKIYKGYGTRFSGRPLTTLDIRPEGVDLTGYKAFFTLCGITKEFNDITQTVQVDFNAEETATFPLGLNYAEIIIRDTAGHDHPFSTAIPCMVVEFVDGDIELDNFDMTLTTDIQENTIVINFTTEGTIGTFLHDELEHRDLADQHPISAITGLEEELRQKEGRAYVALDKIKPYLYNITYANVDYKFAKDYFLTKKPVINAGSCSTVRNGNIVGRAFDWIYDSSAGFVIRTPRTAGKYATLGVSTGVPRLTEEFMESGVYNAESFKLLPFYTTDAINEYGLTASILLVPLDKGQTTGTTPAIEQRDEICGLMLVRYIVDNFQTAQEAVEYLRDYVSVYSPQGLADMGYESHFMISDKEKSYALEFVENEIVIKDITSKPYMTNFYLDGVTFNADGTVYTPSDVPSHLPTSQGITENGSGLERFNRIVSNYGDSATITGMRSLMNSLKFTNAYLVTTNPQWNTEFVGTWEDFGTFTVDSPASDFTELKNYIRSIYENRQRDGKTWQTVHSAVYDLENKTLNLVVQEDGQELEFGFDYYTRKEVDKLVNNEKEARELADNTLQANIDVEAETRELADTALDNRIDSEEQARIDADTALGGRIDDEEDVREQADQTLQNNIDQLSEDLSKAIEDEAQERADEDSALGTRIDNEVSARTTAISDLNTALQTETTNRENADGALEQSIREEEDRATTAETNLNTAIEAEETDRIAAVQALQLAIDIINGKIPEQATTSNKLADKEFVNSSISTNTANFLGTFNSVAEMEAYSGTKTNNDYAFVIGEDESGNTEYNRYKWTTSETPNKWKYEYTLNNSSFTAVQWAAINSTITATKVGEYDSHISDTTIHVTSADKTNWNGKADDDSVVHLTGTETVAPKVFQNSGNAAALFLNNTTNSPSIELRKMGVTQGYFGVDANRYPFYTQTINGTWSRLVRATLNSAIGSATLPVYVDANGQVQSITSYQGNAAGLTGLTATVSELNYMDGVTSNVQTQLNGKATSEQGAKADTAIQPSDNVSELTNDAGYITGITSLMVTTALGYTPYNSTNPNGYQTSAQVNTAIASYHDSTKQDTLESGTNIKTINGNSVLGSGNLTITGLPDQTGQSGKFLKTDGTNASWDTVVSTTITYWE